MIVNGGLHATWTGSSHGLCENVPDVVDRLRCAKFLNERFVR
ncbi:MAG: hypothetical protein AVDCRST_MAG02-1669 [uncultured Rubrobacteraceae bacterium]|uniref:Uncharacterized protein n=1 Tax=uncultured Rubrobacteraceae bacterium TaxID=349277 RepID=A0A6J4R1V2_9ACTN|nr:MAG: hypothetical protein AVDCRST_MAG02-1669 [uncultured Rubrobacteraceae bacterium]